MSCENPGPVYQTFEEYPVYDGEDLGLTYTAVGSTFKIWSPTAEEVTLHLYENGRGGDPVSSRNLHRDDAGTWAISVNGDLEGKFYTFQTKINNQWQDETPGLYTKAVGVNGLRAYILNMESTNPKNWSLDKRPPLRSYNDIIIYELHVRDISIDPNSGIRFKGKFIGLTETGTHSEEGESSGIDHLKELGVTHVHILPMFDFRSIDETKLSENKFNWGYEPQNYNVPEGSYATDPYDPVVRIREMKQMVQALHENGIRVIMDVVYNHTGFGDAANLSFSLAVPGYYYRQNADGSLSDASACGNETASERPMMRKFILQSVEYWVREYHIDGFRFDLMGIHDIETMNEVSTRLRNIDPSIFVYGEGWKAGSSPIPDEQLALKKNVPKLKHVAAFSDEIRDGIKGSWNDWESPGFASGNTQRKEGVKFGIVGGTQHKQVDYTKVNESDAPWAPQASQCIVYVSCHDNHTLYDKLKIVNPGASERDILKMHVLSNTIVLTSQGIPFLHAGVDFVRTKSGVENSYESADSINTIRWSQKSEFKEIFTFYKQLIQLRKDHPVFKMNTQYLISGNLTFLEFQEDENLIGYTLSGTAVNDTWETTVVLFNGEDREKYVPVPEGNWKVVLNGTNINQDGIIRFKGDVIRVPSYTAIILVAD